MAKTPDEIARHYGIDPRIFRALIRQESGGNQGAVSPKGAIGRTQLMPGTAAALGVNPHDPIGNLVGGARYLRQQLDAFGGNYHKALAAYNAGPGAVAKYGGVPPYAETQNYVRSILANAKGEHATPGNVPSEAPSRPSKTTRTTSRTIPGVDRSDERRGLILNWLQQRHNPQALIGLATGLQGAQDTPGRTVTTRKVVRGARGASTGATAGATGTVEALKTEAQKISGAKVPYQWGGGHAGQQPHGSPVTPLDCSGAVSRVLGVNPKVSGQFQRWGAPGHGKRVTIYANPQHVLMEIDGHFWGTSATNPGGGAGWIPRSAISSDYLKNFTARHPPGQ